MQIKPYIWTPNLGTIHTPLVRFLLARAVEWFSINTNIRTGHDANRNCVVKGFLESDCTHLWWIDSDITIWDDIPFIEMFKVNEDIVIGNYPIRQDEKIKWCYRIKEWWQESQDLIEVDRMWLGCCVIKREVVQAIVDKHWMFCETQIEANWLTNKTEDIVFCEWAAEMWYKMYLHKKVNLWHIKMIDLSNI